MKPTMKDRNNSEALLAGVCSGIAGQTGWNVWVLRLLFVGFLALKMLWALLAYGALAILFHLADEGFKRPGQKKEEGLESEELAERNRRISELERQFRDLEGR